MPQAKLFALSTCPYCRMARQYLDERGVHYDLVEVDQLQGKEREEAVDEVKKLSGGSSFPVLVSDGQVVVGYNKARIDEVLDLKV